MKNTVLTLFTVALLSTSCGSQKKIAALEQKNKETQDLLNTATVALNTCLAEKNALDKQIDFLKKTNYDLVKTNSDLLNNMGNLTTLSSKVADNLEKSLESLKEKDLTIKHMRDALTKKDSVTIALVTSLKGAIGNLNDTDIEINVEKGVVFI